MPNTPPRRAGPLATLSLSFAVVALSLSLASCAVATTGASPSTACDADIRATGPIASASEVDISPTVTSVSAADEVELTLINNSAAVHCLASEVTLRFWTPAVRDAVSASPPAGWTMSELTCENGPGVCGFVWKATPGLGAGQVAPGFRLVKPNTVRIRSVTVGVGDRSVELRLGTGRS